MATELSEDVLRAISAALVTEGCPTVVRLLNEGKYPEASALLHIVVAKQEAKLLELRTHLNKIDQTAAQARVMVLIAQILMINLKKREKKLVEALLANENQALKGRQILKFGFDKYSQFEQFNIKLRKAKISLSLATGVRGGGYQGKAGDWTSWLYRFYYLDRSGN